MWDEDTEEYMRGSLFSVEEGVTLGDLFYRNDLGYLFKMQDPGVHTTNFVSIGIIRSQEPEYVYMWGKWGHILEADLATIALQAKLFSLAFSALLDLAPFQPLRKTSSCYTRATWS